MSADDWQAAGLVDTRHSPHVRLQSVPLRQVRLGEGFWRPRLATNAARSLSRFLELMEEHGVVDNFRRAGGRKDARFRVGSFGSESDLYKWLEAACLVLQTEDHPELRAAVAMLTEAITAAQEPDGYLYLNTLFGGETPPPRFSRLEGSHELYCAGHLMQAAVAHYRATGREELLQVARRFADLLVREFGPGKRETTDGHPEVELALIELYRATGERTYLDLAGFFLSRPQSLENLPPIAERPALVHHAVRSGYLCCGGADWVAETGDERMLGNLRHLWQDLVGGKLYLTGGVGARREAEAFGLPYELPNADAYAETCAAIAHAMWAWRMLLLTGEAGFADVMERILYNGFLSGVSLEGTNYFYMNPLASDGGYRRVPWFGCNCCPPNVHRTLASVPGLMFSTSAEGLWVHLYDAARADLATPDGTPLRLTMTTRYPWEGTVEIELEPQIPAEFSLLLRIPAWAKDAQAEVNGQPVAEPATPGSYLTLRRIWQAGDTVRLELPLPVQVLASHPRVAENRGCVALQRGPVVYCVESVDYPDANVADLALRLPPGDPGGGFRAEWQPDLLGGVTVLRGEGVVAAPDADSGPLYHPAGSVPTPRRPVAVTGIPYYAWANRGDSALRVWLPAVNADLAADGPFGPGT